MQQFFAQHLSAGTDGLAPRRFGIGKDLPFLIPAQVGAFTHT